MDLSPVFFMQKGLTKPKYLQFSIKPNSYNYTYICTSLHAALTILLVSGLYSIFPVGRAAESSEFQLSNDNFTAVLDFISATRKMKIEFI